MNANITNKAVLFAIGSLALIGSIEAIKRLKMKRQEIDKKRQDRKPSGETKATEIKADIEADLAKLKASLEQLGSKLKSELATK